MMETDAPQRAYCVLALLTVRHFAGERELRDGYRVACPSTKWEKRTCRAARGPGPGAVS
jgi:hypothetical protein